MERPEVLERNNKILNHLVNVPQKVLALHGTENVTEFVLHDICSKNCFNLQKAAYVVDNPDFDCLKGIAGFCADQAYMQSVIWETPELFSQFMQKAEFNKQVRNILRPSYRRSHKTEQETALSLGNYLGYNNPSFCSWSMKHDNHGILIYDTNEQEAFPQDILVNGACLLSFCPIF